MYALLLALLLLFVVGGLPQWHWHPWGYAPSSFVAGMLVVLVVLLVVSALRPPS